MPRLSCGPLPPLLPLLALVLALAPPGTHAAAPATATGLSWVDPDTPRQHRAVTSLVDGRALALVFSDEFQVEGRSFADGQDPRWTAMDKDDYTNDALQYYSQDRVTTSQGCLNITTVNEDVQFLAQDKDPSKPAKRMTKNYQSGMVQGWNKFCFTGGVVEISAKLPGAADIGGLWPAMWLLGNLARATYVGSSDNVWPWSYDTCSRDLQRQQEISACNLVNHFDLSTQKGRGAPEIDILEAMPGKEVLHSTPINRPYFSASLQTSPGVSNAGSRPSPGSAPTKPNKWYHNDISYGDNTSLNIFFYGTSLVNTNSPEKSYQTDAISANSQLDKTHFEDFHKYRLEWATGDNGYLKWFLDDKLLYGISSATLNLTGSVIPDEPMYLILNTAISKTWGFPAPCPANCPCSCFDCRKSECLCGTPARMCDNFPADFLIDYVRVYQSPDIDSQKVGCSTPERPTSKFITAHESRYKRSTDEKPLKEITPGGGSCHKNSHCSSSSTSSSVGAGSASGVCRKGQCRCFEGYTGPHCLAHAAGDPIQWETPNSWHQSVKPFHFSTSLQLFCVAVVVGFVALIGYKVKHEGSRSVGRKVYEAIDDTSYQNQY